MNILFDHVDWNSSAGPHWAARKLAEYLLLNGHGVNTGNDDVQLAYVIATQKSDIPLIQRLDGIYYDVEQDYHSMNEPIRRTYEMADGVVFQSDWSRRLIEHHFGKTDNYRIIHNGTDFDYIKNIPAAVGLDNHSKIWCCASSWFYEDGRQRYIKRLEENIRYFQEHSADNDILCVAGDMRDYVNPDASKIVFVGNLEIADLISLYKRADYFIHLGRFDSCPNVVVDARAAGCQIICSSLGGTIEVAGLNAIVIEEDEWNFEPFAYNVPSTLDFSRKIENVHNKYISMECVAEMYLEFFNEIV